MTISRPISPGLGPLREPLPGLAGALPSPPQIAESGDPFASLRIVRLVSRLERGAPQRLDDVTDRLNATYVDWQFSTKVVTDTLIGLAASWMTDYRTVAGIVLEEGPYGATVTIEDSPRVDPWLVLQSDALEARCEAALVEFARRDRISGDG
jgi:hypothetical protein